MIRAFLDANVLFSAALTENGVARALFVAARLQGEVVELVATPYCVEEAHINLARKAPQSLIALEDLLRSLQIVPDPPHELVSELSTLLPDPDDVHILAGAVRSQADLLVTGNTRDFGHLFGTRVRNVLVVRIRDALRIVELDE